jgi:hypothetical protein
MTSLHTRYRRIIDAYRAKLMEVNPRACDEVDDWLYDLGEGWVSDDRPLELDKPMTAGQIAKRFGLEVHNIRAWARRHPDKIRKISVEGNVLFIPREILAYRAGK